MYHRLKSIALRHLHTTTHTCISNSFSNYELTVSWNRQSQTKKCKKKQLHWNPNHQWWEPWSACNPILVETGSARTKSSYSTSLNATKMYTELCTVFPKLYSWWHIWNCSQLRHLVVFFCALHKVIQGHSICKLNWLLRNCLYCCNMHFEDSLNITNQHKHQSYIIY